MVLWCVFIGALRGRIQLGLGMGIFNTARIQHKVRGFESTIFLYEEEHDATCQHGN